MARFVHADSTRILDVHDEEIQLRGVGLSNWLQPEGYMWQFGDAGDSHRKIESFIRRVAGHEFAKSFWKTLFDTYISEADIKFIAEQGFNHVRLPINSRVIRNEDGSSREESFALIDRVIDWCRQYDLYVLLDLHGAPGGQTGTNIDDSANGKPELFMNESYKEQTKGIWHEIALRYRNEPVVMGYDLLNEPLPYEWSDRYSADLVSLYKDLTEVVRDVDTEHLIMYEGTKWATNWGMFTSKLDANSCLQFHKYWSSPDTQAIQPYLDKRDELDTPIYMGEGGENNAEWIYAATDLYESHNIGWSNWSYKKFSTRTSMRSIIPPTRWGLLRSALDGECEIERSEAQEILNEYLECMRTPLNNTDIIRAYMLSSPIVIPAWGFSFSGKGCDGAGKSGVFHFRAHDGANVEWSNEVLHPVNPFDQSNGRAYEASEDISVRLLPGQWLAFDIRNDFDIEAYRAENSQGDSAPVRLEKIGHGIKVVACAETMFRRLVLSKQSFNVQQR